MAGLKGAYIAERAIDAVARHLNLDQVEVRRKNFIEQADFPYKPYNGSQWFTIAAITKAASIGR